MVVPEPNERIFFRPRESIESEGGDVAIEPVEVPVYRVVTVNEFHPIIIFKYSRVRVQRVM